MITNISLFTVWVRDQDEACAFYVDKLGFEVATDLTMGDGYRWLTVRHPEQPELELTLMRPGPPLDPADGEYIAGMLDKGGFPGVGLSTDDCHATIAELKAKGVDIVQEPSDRPYGIEAIIRDNSGNWMVMVERKEYTPT